MEEYLKFMEETNKSLYAINKVITFSDRILKFAFMTSQFEDRNLFLLFSVRLLLANHRALNEMEICYKDVTEAKVLDFLKQYLKDLKVITYKTFNNMERFMLKERLSLLPRKRN